MNDFDFHFNVHNFPLCAQVVSGVPVRNGDQPAEEICSLVLHLYSTVKAFHSELNLQLMAGVHSGKLTDGIARIVKPILSFSYIIGPCVASVVGLKRPRYCL